MRQLVGDIGGTNARFALIDPDGGQPVGIMKLPTAEFQNFNDALASYLERQSSPRVDSALIAVATPVAGDIVDLTNNHWKFSISAVEKQIGIASLQFVNDFTALAYSLPALRHEELVQVGEPALPQSNVVKGVKGLIGPGTGLGVSGLVASPAGWVALQGEGGHSSFAAGNEREFALLEYLQKLHHHVSAERLLSGPGIEGTYQALAALDAAKVDKLTAAEISRRAVQGSDQRSVETLDIFCRHLGKRAADLALILGAWDGVYIGGGIVPQLGDYFLKSGFRDSFDNKGRMGVLLKDIPIAIIMAEYAALTGAARMLQDSA